MSVKAEVEGILDNLPVSSGEFLDTALSCRQREIAGRLLGLLGTRCQGRDLPWTFGSLKEDYERISAERDPDDFKVARDHLFMRLAEGFAIQNRFGGLLLRLDESSQFYLRGDLLSINNIGQVSRSIGVGR